MSLKKKLIDNYDKIIYAGLGVGILFTTEKITTKTNILGDYTPLALMIIMIIGAYGLYLHNQRYTILINHLLKTKNDKPKTSNPTEHHEPTRKDVGSVFEDFERMQGK